MDFPFIKSQSARKALLSLLAAMMLAVGASATTPSAPDHKRLYVKTNAVGWAMLVTNVAGEFECGPKLSMSVPVYYSGFNYFTYTTKFRCFVLQPEVRYWLRPDYLGFFGGLHFGLGWYNYATGGTYRVQDHNANTPSWGGGIAIGWRGRFKSDPDCHWLYEVSVGGGYYGYSYDRFLNRHDGPYVDHHTGARFVVDQVSLSLVYRFDLRRGDK